MADIDQRPVHARRHKVMTTCYLDREQAAELRELSARTRIPVAALVRAGVNLVLSRGDALGDAGAVLAGAGAPVAR